jgi:Calcineurin-like phosphoesterase
MSAGAAVAFLRRLLWPIVLLVMALSSASAAPLPARIVAVGDLHGDFAAWQDIARDAGLTDAAGHWAGGKTVLVQMGDITDRGADSLKIVRSLQQLQKEAPKKGGKVYVVLGNHEAMNLLGDFRYVTPGEFAAFADASSPARRDQLYALNRAAIESAYKLKDPKLTPDEVHDAWLKATPLGWVEHRLAWSPAGELGKWATKNPAILKIDGTLFVHGGISSEAARLPLDEVNRRVATAMAAGDDSDGSILNDPLGPLWYRGLVTRDPDAEAVRAAVKPPAPHLTAEQELDAVLAAYGAKRLVIAHTPDLKGIEILYGGKLARIDTGISRYYGGPVTWLEILGQTMVPHTVRRSAP